jgi:hypothetical protein
MVAHKRVHWERYELQYVSIHIEEGRLFSTRKMMVMFLAVVASMALGAVSASSASASVVNAKFSYPSITVTTAGVTIKKNGESAKSCTLKSPIGIGVSGSGFIGSNESSSGGVRFRCTDLSSLLMWFAGGANYDTETGLYYLHLQDKAGQSLEGPWGWYFQETGNTDNWTWVNGSGSTPSTLTLNEQYVGHTESGEKITISGTLTAKTSTGGLVTLSH